MHVTTWKTRVRYSETDRMGYCYYGNYAVFFELGRVEALRSLGIRYLDLENAGVMLPVGSMDIRYLKPLTYDDELRIETSIVALPTGSRVSFSYRIFNTLDELTTTGSSVLVSVDASSGKPCPAPANLIEALRPYFSDKA
ncbi:MAG: YbgC/FadM family acyl-CoA thioesterase [Bacteroidetes bacterium]|nr:YbgC/FadM family acyl-CoA thioesterase [Bacteroidota bacterium]